MEFDFLKPISNEILSFKQSLSSQHLGSKIVLHTKNEFPNLDVIKVALIGVLENRDDNGVVQKWDLSLLRKQFYNMFPGNWSEIIADLGDIPAGNSKADSFFALQQIITNLIKRKIIPIIIGGTQDLTYAMYRSFDNLDQMANLVVVDNKFDLGKQEDEITKNSYLTRIIADQPNNLFNYCNIGYQTYYNSQEEIDLIHKLYFDAYRLGEISNEIELAEPMLRDADIVSIDLTSVKSASSGNFIDFEPNGFNGKEICALSRYAGISDKVSCIGIFNHNNTSQESLLIAQIIWYFIEGVNYRSNEYPLNKKENFLKYNILVDQDELVFYKSNKTERWWIEIPFFYNVNNKLKNATLLPCSHKDYLKACNQEMPYRWWNAYRKSAI